jgi:peptidyl-prolyl cis-trans isomerase SurA
VTAPAFLALAALLAAAPPSERLVVDRVAATVNGETVTLSDLAERAGSELVAAERMDPGAAREEARKKALERALETLVAEKLLEAQARELQLDATDAQIDAAVEDIKRRNEFDDAALDAALREQGLDRAAFRQQLRREIEAFSVLQYKVRSRVKVSDDDLRSYFVSHPEEFQGKPEVRARHIFVPVGGDGDARARAKAEAALARVKAGEDFAKVAREVSQGPSAAEGGELGWIPRGAIDARLDEAVFALEEGEATGVLKVGPGYHVLKVEERRVAGGKPFEEAKDQIRDKLAQEQAEGFRAQYLAELRRDAIVDVKLPELR